MSRLNTKFAIMQDWPFFCCILYNFFGEGSNSVIASELLANLKIISEEYCKNDEILFQNVYGNRESVYLSALRKHAHVIYCNFSRQ